MTYKLGLIGTGVQGSRFLKTILEIGGAEVTHTCNSKRDYKDLLAQKLDGVIIAANPALNTEMIKHANIVGIPVLCEKPVGLYLSDVQKLEKCKIPILVNYTHLYSPTYQSVKSSITAPINRIISIGYNKGPNRTFSSLYDYAPHDLSMCLDLCPGEYEIVKQSAASKNDGIIYNIQLQIGQTEVQIIAGNGGDCKKRQLAVFCVNGEQFIYDADKELDYTAPMNNLVKHFLEVIGGAKPNQSFQLTSNIHSILYKLGKNYESKR